MKIREYLKLNKKTNYKNIINYIRTNSNEFGFQLNEGDYGQYIKSCFSHEQGKKFINSVNLLGYLDFQTGLQLEDLIKSNTYDLYTKSVDSDDLESIFNDGIGCLNSTTSGVGSVPNSIDSISFEDTITFHDELPFLINDIKNNYGISQGGNPINGTLIIKIPKNLSKDKIVYYNENTNTYDIKPEFIIGFLPVYQDHYVGKLVTKDTINVKNK